MLLLNEAINMFETGLDEEEVRQHLREWTNQEGEPATCSYVEEVMRAAIRTLPIDAQAKVVVERVERFFGLRLAEYQRRDMQDMLIGLAAQYPAPNDAEARAWGEVLEERRRQDQKWGEQNHNPYIYLAIILEELGELAEAILQTQFGGPKGGWTNVRKEAIHTAATALATIQCLDRDKWYAADVEFNYPNGEKEHS